MEHKLENIANRAIPVDGTDLIPEPGEIVQAEITPRLQYMIKNNFFKDLGEIKKAKIKKKKEKEMAKAMLEPSEDYMPKPHKKKGKKLNEDDL